MTLSDYLVPRSGRIATIAARLHVSESLVTQWGRGKPVPPDRCAELEEASDGLVPCEGARTDLVWCRTPDAAWPWHPMGRPLYDPVATARRKAAAPPQPSEPQRKAA